MQGIFDGIVKTIGNTPLVRLYGYEKKIGSAAELYAKLEFFNPAGSVKDRAALYIINRAEREGKLSEGSVIVEATSGNTGIGLCAVARAKGYRCIIVLPETMSEERRALIRAYGGELVLTDGKAGMSGAIARAEQIVNETPRAFMAGQFVNPANVAAHYETTGPEIWNALNGQLDIFVAGVGTGGTITGTGKFLKEKKSAVKIVAVEPADSPVLSGGKAGPHKLQGIGAGFVPKIYGAQYVDKVIRAEFDRAVEAVKSLAACEGILVGISSGAALSAAAELAVKSENAGKKIAVLCPDGGEKYLSTGIF